jgi:GT2 family glycosyltransferase
MTRATSAQHLLPTRAKAPDVDVGVIYTREAQWMPRLLTSLAEAARGLTMRLLLVDNASAEGVDAWTGYVANAAVLRNERRLGYAANLNRILAGSTARYTLVMNTDMYFDTAEPCIARMVRFMDSHPACGVAGCGLYHADGRFAYPARRFQSFSVVLARRCGLGRFLRSTLDRYLYRDRSADETWEPDWLSGAFLMVRREAIDEVGGFDEGFGKYFEDVDICLRMARAGWKVFYYGGTYCYHLERRASKNLVSLDALRHLRAYLRWQWKWGFAPTPAASPRTAERRAA